MNSIFKKIKEGFSLDYRSLALFRIVLGSVLLWDLAIRSLDITAHYTDNGVLPRITAIQTFRDTTDFCIHLMSGSLLGQSLIFIFHAAVILAFILGYRTTISSVLGWLLIISLHSRNELLQHGGDHYLRILSFWAMFLPLGKCLSIDSKKRNEPKHDFFSIVSIAFIFQMCAVYWFAAAEKVGPEWISEHSALQYALSISFFSQPFGKWLLNYPTLLGVLTSSTLWLEYILPFFFFLPFFTAWFRSISIISLFIFHLLIGMALYLGSLPYVFMIPLVALIPYRLWSIQLRKIDKPFHGMQLPPIHLPIGKFFSSFRKLLAPTVSVLVSVLAIYQLLENIETLPGKPRVIPEDLRWVGSMLRIDQDWGMFAPYPYKIHGWYVIQTESISGKKEAIQGREPASNGFKRPSSVTSLFRNGHWLSFAIKIYAERPELFSNWADSICKNDSTIDGEKLASVDLYFMRLVTEADFSQSFPYKERIGHYECQTKNEDILMR